MSNPFDPEKWLRSNKWIRLAIRKAKTGSLPGLGGVPVYDVLQFIYRESVEKDDIITRAKSVAFSFFISLFPSILILISLGAMLPIDLVGWLEDILGGVFPATAEDFIYTVIGDIDRLPHSGLLSLGFVLAIYFSSAGLNTLLTGFQKSYPITFKKRSWIKQQVVAIFLTGLLFAMFISTNILIIAGNWIIRFSFEHLQPGIAESFVVQLLKWIIIVSLFYSIIALIYKIGPSMHKKFRFFSPGATIATTVSILLTLGFSLYVNNFGTYNKLYGSIGAIIVIMVWLQLVCTIILLGFELNASIAVHKDLKSHDSSEE